MEDLSSGNLVELNSEVNNAETGLSMTGVSILAGTQKEVPVSIRTGLLLCYGQFACEFLVSHIQFD
jgi:hypothetical protein